MEQIKNRFTREVMCGGLSLKVVLEKHVKWRNGEEGGERANLSRADLRGADLRGANLFFADLRDADLICANLRDANLRGSDLICANLFCANLRDANLRGSDLNGADLRGANLFCANLRDANLICADLNGANLSRADLRGADLRGADLNGADLRGADLRGADLNGVPKIKNIHQAVYAAASQPNALEMGNVHTCETTHCRAGWVVTLAGEAGAAMESRFGWSVAASLIYLASDPTLEKAPDFFASNEDALADMKRLAELEAARAA